MSQPALGTGVRNVIACLHRPARRLVAAAALATLGLGAAGEIASAQAADSTAYRDTVLAEDGLVSYWRAAEAAGASAARDATGRNRGRYRNGPRLGVAGLVPTSASTAVRYDGRDDSVRIPDSASLDLESTFTLEAWAKPLSRRRHATIIRKHGAYVLKAEGTGVRLAFWDRSGRRRGLGAKRRLIAGRRHHVVGTYGGGTMRLFVDGELVARRSGPPGAVPRTNGRPLSIGAQSFRGVIDEAAVYEVALTSGEVAEHYGAATRIAAGAPPESPTPGDPPAGSPPAASPPPSLDASPASSGAPLWSGDFETGDLRQYSLVQGAAPDRITLAPAPVRKGAYAARLTAHDDDLQGGSNPRAQLIGGPQHVPGQEHYVGWSTYFPLDFPAIQGPGAFFVFFQFHGRPFTGSPPLGWGVAPDGRIELGRNQQYGYDRIWSMPLVRGRWVSFVARVNWSKDPSAGFVEMWVDGVKQTFATNGQQRLNTQTSWTTRRPSRPCPRTTAAAGSSRGRSRSTTTR